MKPEVLYISHGGGPLPLLGDEGHQEMVATLKHIAQTIPKPESIVVVSAHWETQSPMLINNESHSLLYDYYGFPEASYQIQYPATGDQQLVEAIQSGLTHKGLSVGFEAKRGLDHGVFVPLKIMYPNADIPAVQLSILKRLDPAEHIALGQALSELGEKVLVIGSGFSFHNMREFFAPEKEVANRKNQAFEDWLVCTCYASDITENERMERFLNWEQAPFARFCHPREEHLMPLHVCYGVQQRAADAYFSAKILGKKAGMFYWRAH
ncbi:MAG: hypothetical protein HLUCCO02_05735 [Idiomarinaceae bacterium HL-53]|nr:MAG: hypothetical protein HLUCCO02_05735 [Idiomarinaceae bacterium HL-53]CUS48054.1 Aromatic ring-opening dioxygenase, catalytic subunit, LigB family [Idiomarinaceae bacterium HL-53]